MEKIQRLAHERLPIEHGGGKAVIDRAKALR
jgi:hypothetical protein